LKEAIGYTPGNIALYKQAFTHKSVIPQISSRIQSNERLEFLGDAVLSLVIGAYLYYKHPDKDEGFLSQMRSRVVNRELFNELGYKMELQNWMQDVSPQKVEFEDSSSMLGNTFEALVGAIFVDKGYEAAKKFFEKTVLVYHLNIEDIQSSDSNFKSRLLEWGQKNLKKVSFTLTQVERKGNKLEFAIEVFIDGEPYGKGIANKKKKAEQQASKEAMEKLKMI
jgi:ribonuclease III